MAFSFKVDFYFINDLPNTLNKTLTSASSLFSSATCSLVENTSIKKPSILVDTKSITNHNLFSEKPNYCYINAMNKYYFIEDITLVGNYLWRFDLKLDVLMTYASAISGSVGLVKRCSTGYDTTLDDPEHPVKDYFTTSYTVITPPRTFNYYVSGGSWNYILELDSAITPEASTTSVSPTSSATAGASAPSNLINYGFKTVNGEQIPVPSTFRYLIKSYGCALDIVNQIVRAGLASCIRGFYRCHYSLYTGTGSNDLATIGSYYIKEFSYTSGTNTGLIIISNSGTITPSSGYTNQIILMGGPAINRLPYGTFSITSSSNLSKFLWYHRNEYKVFVPHSDVGWVSLPPNRCVDKVCGIYYTLDISTYTSNWYIFVGSSSSNYTEILASGKANLFIEVSIADTSYYQDSVKLKQAQLNNIFAGLNAGIGAMSAKNDLGILGVASKTTQSIMNTNLATEAIRPQVSYTPSTSALGVYDCQLPILFRMIAASNADSTFLHTYGAPVNATGSLAGNITILRSDSSYSIHFLSADIKEINAYATSDEIDEIKRIVSDGIYIKYES